MIRDITKLSADTIIRFVKEKKENFWLREREERPIKLFHEVARRVPAYKDFLRKNKIQPDKIKTFRDFQLVPPTSKADYLQWYPLEKLCWDRSLKKAIVFTSTSGSTGEPFYFPRTSQLDWQYSILAQLFLENSSYHSGGPVLVIVGFGMGVWIGGLITYQAFEIASKRSCPVSIITPGVNKTEIFKTLTELAPNFKETVLVGYPPFLKDILDEAESHGINLKKLNLRLLSAAEAYTEKFRDYIAQKGHIKDVYRDTLNIYGTADIGAMAWETPTAILLRRLAMKNTQLFEEIFPQISKTPTLAQYNPLFITFEAPNNEILLTGDNTIPLVRYAVGDHGGVYNFSEIVSKLEKFEVDFEQKARAVGIEKNIYQLPFVYVYERNDFSATLYGLQIYPETIREVLIQKSFHTFLTGKFTMATKFDDKQNQFLEINLELSKGATANDSLKAQTLREIVATLRIKNAEFKELHTSIGDQALPRLVFWPAEDPLYFKPGIKQKWVNK